LPAIGSFRQPVGVQSFRVQRMSSHSSFVQQPTPQSALPFERAQQIWPVA
jgi:hypothetical protein